MNDVDEFFGGSGAPGAKFLSVGDEVEGVILAMKMAQVTDIKGNLKTYDDGNPIMQAVITLQTDAEADEDDGRRRLYVNKSRMKTAISEAIRHAGAERLEIGGTLTVKYVANGTPPDRGLTAPKLFEASYKIPDPDRLVADLASSFHATEYDGEPF